MSRCIEESKKRFKRELKQLISQKCDEINHYVAGCDSPFTHSQISVVQENLCEITDVLNIKS